MALTAATDNSGQSDDVSEPAIDGGEESVRPGHESLSSSDEPVCNTVFSII